MNETEPITAQEEESDMILQKRKFTFNAEPEHKERKFNQSALFPSLNCKQRLNSAPEPDPLQTE